MELIESNYHRLLRIGGVVMACVLAFQSGIVTPYTAELSRHTANYMATAIGVDASVQPTELNVYTAELTKLEQELNVREAALQEREIDTGFGASISSESNETTFFLSAILFIILVLIILNYALDFARARAAVKPTSSQQQPAV